MEALPHSAPARSQSRSPRVATSSQVDASAYVDEDSALIASTHNDSSSVASVEVRSGTCDGGDEVGVSALNNKLLSDTSEDLNMVCDGDISGHFGVVGSGDEAEKDAVEPGEYQAEEDVKAYCAPQDDGDRGRGSIC
ncbi:hypothetical protein JG687_00018074 [Phytophthora cactorum]|uniref:Uncharacterized protein n=1 Tax=Phytophthora cactorum TaxID=29920 RepID=A0A329RFN5_9STRA|nr:hypothetical protein JG687_00018074 [Phytophthora cactorum]RAW23465.1 hypothetical protein PC110_g20098 [Phytophthora cactorum]